MRSLKLEDIKNIDRGYEVRIELKSKLGPEGTAPVGKVVAQRNNGLLCDFGLNHTYVIPMKAIKRCFAVRAEAQTTRRKHKTRKNAR